MKTRPALPGEQSVPRVLGIPPLPPPPADIAALAADAAVEALIARRVHKLALRGVEERT